MRIRAATAEELFERGAHKAPYYVKGYEALLAVNLRHNAIKHILLTPGVDEMRAWLELWRWLDRVDPPQPPLQLVRTIDDVPPPLVDFGHMLTPHAVQRDDHLAFALRMAKMYAQRPKLYR